jgi:hypothetical protein
LVEGFIIQLANITPEIEETHEKYPPGRQPDCPASGGIAKKGIGPLKNIIEFSLIDK